MACPHLGSSSNCTLNCRSFKVRFLLDILYEVQKECLMWNPVCDVVSVIKLFVTVFRDSHALLRGINEFLSSHFIFLDWSHYSHNAPEQLKIL